ncbi:oxidoreductase [Asticcacaulis machinosus]|uniref:Oxidoreductase n=1 Tax=Asticcacaulis machinosus TaxID=2984211 RepID=A0ABT5HJ35_9CAUL|nr:oxidoreductase [Asticcacaulis machinosus]MDC7675609.1 oxidoreductase [Asticcacaulis machinosus]
MVSNVNAAIVGFGNAGRIFHTPLIRATKGLRLHTIVSSRPADVTAAVPGVRVAPDLEIVLNDPEIDLVVIATPNALHAPQALAALRAGKHVVVDKPFAINLDEAEALMVEAKAAGRLLSVFHNRRWDADFLTVQRLIADDKLGDITRLISRFDRFRPKLRDRWREQDVPGAGLWFDLGPHLVDQVLCLFGKPVSLMADMARQRDGSVVDDYFNVTLKYERLRVTVSASVLTPAAGPRFEVHGTRGTFVKYGLDPQEDALKAGGDPTDPSFGIDAHEGSYWPVIIDDHVGMSESVMSERGRHLSFYEAIAAAIMDDAPNPVPAEEAYQVMRILELGQLSALEGTEVHL